VSVPPELLARMRASQQPQLPGGGRPSPAAAPMATPEKKEGKEQMGALKVHIAMNMLEQALPLLGAESKEGRAVLKVLSSLANSFGENDTSDLVPAEMADIVSSMPSVGGGAPQQKELMKLMAQGPRPAQIPPGPAAMPQPGM
jgi:hypothetical protein